MHGIDGSGLLTDVWIFPYREGAPRPPGRLRPDGVLYVSDLGSDDGPPLSGRRRGWSPHPAGPVRLASGMGPRHMAWSDGHWYVAGELDGTVRVYEVSGGLDGSEASGTALTSPAALASLAGVAPEIAVVPASGSEGHNQPSHLEVSGGLVYVANRGPDTIAVFAGPGLEPVAEVPLRRRLAPALRHRRRPRVRGQPALGRRRRAPAKGGVPQPVEEVSPSAPHPACCPCPSLLRGALGGLRRAYDEFPMRVPGRTRGTGSAGASPFDREKRHVRLLSLV
ncbi:lactonase family protein [Streptosporangium vulgare]|uniref:lactonase family protein n=1 Tax=Streptosporangium vulgare TaxID=46190 RepID=UPI0031E32365